MLITMFTDISLDQTTGAAAWALWAKESGQTLRYAAVFKSRIMDTNEAEIKAVVNGLSIVLCKLQPPRGSKIIAQSDSKIALDILAGKIISRRFGELVAHRNALLANRNIAISYRYVQGHQGNKTPRAAVNTWCDRECRKLLRSYRSTLQEEMAL